VAVASTSLRRNNQHVKNKTGEASKLLQDHVD